MKTHLFKIECLTDMHVGNGEASYSIIDNEVQKDTVLQDVPIIHASGVKGALKEHIERIWSKDCDGILKVFGGVEEYGEADPETGKKKTRTVEGSYKFFSALCLARPLRVTDGAAPYILATSNAVLERFSLLLNGLGRPDVYGKAIGILADGANIEVEGITAATKNCVTDEPMISKKFAVLDNLQDYALPVRARNVLNDNGISENVWHEELVPHKSIFFFAIIVPDGDDNFYSAFKEAIQESAIQFGGNASIGNGYTTVAEVYSV